MSLVSTAKVDMSRAPLIELGTSASAMKASVSTGVLWCHCVWSRAVEGSVTPASTTGRFSTPRTIMKNVIDVTFEGVPTPIKHARLISNRPYQTTEAQKSTDWYGHTLALSSAVIRILRPNGIRKLRNQPPFAAPFPKCPTDSHGPSGPLHACCPVMLGIRRSAWLRASGSGVGDCNPRHGPTPAAIAGVNSILAVVSPSR